MELFMRLAVSALLSAACLASSLAFAEIPAVVQRPGSGTSPGTGQTASAGIPGPVGMSGNAGHPDPGVGNRPPLPWFQNSFYPEVAALENAVTGVYNWAYYNDSFASISYYSGWLSSIMTNIRGVTYASGYDPIYYPAWGYYVTRGDLLFYNYWWVRPLYFQILREAAIYNANTYPGYPGRQEYLQALIRMKNAYHRFEICIHGRNGSDPDAADDDEVRSFEQDAGI
jgi:hypothetical protein